MMDRRLRQRLKERNELGRRKNEVRGWASSVVLAVLAAVPAMAQTVVDSPLWSWRVTSRNVSTQPVEDIDGRSRALKVTYPGSEDRRQFGRIEFSCSSLALPLGAWIPPYVGIRARQIAYSARCRDAGDNRILLKVNANQREIWEEELLSEERWKADAWTDVTRDIRLGDDRRIARVTLEVAGTNRMEFALSDVRLVLDDGTSYGLMNAELPRYETGMACPMASAPAKPFPKRPRMQFGVSASWYVRHLDEVPVMGRFFRKYLPEYDILLSLDGTPEPMVAQTMADAPDNVFFQFQKGRNDIRYLGLRDALVKDLHGNPQPEVFNSVHGCSPLVREALEDQLAYIGSIGINNVQQFDYTWYYPKGPWGFDAYSAKAFREDLSGLDEGLVLGPSDREPERTIRFWDYFEAYEGKGTRFGPERIGCRDWDEFRPEFGSPFRRRLHWLLVTYEWLRQAQRFGRWSRQYCHGAPHDYLLNGEGSVNGNDHVYLLRLADTGVVSPEYFHDTGRDIGVIYRRAGRYVREARRFGKKLGLVLETSSGGGSTQPYWSCRTGYVISYVLSALGHESFHYDHVPDGAGWSDHVDREGKPGLWKSLALGMSCARAYRQAKLDNARKPPFGGVLYVHERTVARNGESKAYARELVRNGVDYEWTDPQELPMVADRAAIVIVSPRIENRDTIPLLEKWKNETPGRRLLVADGEVSRIVGECGLPCIQLNAADDDATALPFRCGSFFVAALFNRVAAERADYGKWKREVWRPAYRRQTYDDAKLLFPDRVTGADAGATVCIEGVGDYRVYSVMDDMESVVTVANGELRLSLGDRFCDLVYYGKDTPEFRSFLLRVKRDRAVSAEFF